MKVHLSFPQSLPPRRMLVSGRVALRGLSPRRHAAAYAAGGLELPGSGPLEEALRTPSPAEPNRDRLRSSTGAGGASLPTHHPSSRPPSLESFEGTCYRLRPHLAPGRREDTSVSPQEKTEYLESLFDLEVMIGELKELSRNLWWTWNPDAQEIFAELSRLVWNASRHNAVAVLGSVSKAELKSRLMDRDFAARTREVLAAFREYLTRERTWCSAHAASFLKNPVAYFCAEFALHESLPLYCGGLGVLAGDHAKSASDLGVPFIGITLFYRQGYFEQLISHSGWQEEHYPSLDRHNLPLEPVLDSQGRPLLLWVEFSQSRIWFQAWRLRVGCAAIYLLDTELPQNDSAYRGLTSSVYGGDMTTRIGQEIIMGIGGVRLLQALGFTPAVYHLNEGHSAFLVLELLRQQLDSGSDLQEAEAWVRDRCVFTTHTPVAEGHDRFSPELMEVAFAGYRSLLDMEAPQFLSYGRTRPDDPNEFFCMTVLALKMSRGANGVSQLHGQVSREMWKELLDSPTYRGPSIGHITNGVHVPGWMARPIRRFWKQHLGPEWETRLMSPDLWRAISDEETITDEEIWALRYHLRRELIEFVRKHVPDTFPASGTERARGFEALLSPDALTIGFARRFATYKRAPLIFSDLPRMAKMLNDPQRPVQLIFSGKAHPQDVQGKEFIQRILDISKRSEFLGKVVFLENYDMNVARHMISGTDLWLNTPRRPLEASGTSGQKVSVHGGLNLSVLDGWWREGYDGTNGWAIGADEHPADQAAQDRADLESLYQTLSRNIIPLFFDRDSQGIPRGWIAKIRRSMQTLIPIYNTDRMVTEYVTRYYLRRK